MLNNLVAKILKRRKINGLIITPPLLNPKYFYSASPLLVGQLKNRLGADVKNLDLNIRFFNMLLSIDYLKKTKEKFDCNGVSYDISKYNYFIENFDRFHAEYCKSYEASEAQEFFHEVLKFICSSYKYFCLDNLNSLEFAFRNFDFNYNNVKIMTKNRKENIFIEFFEEVAEELVKNNVNFVGITIPFPGTFIPALTLARILKEKTNIFVFLGGNFLKEENITNHPDIIGTFCDSVIIGDGEDAVVQVAKYFEGQQKLKNIDGLIYKKKDKLIVNPSKQIMSMDNVANISLDGINIKEYLQDYPLINISISKGCYWGKCVFCSLGPKYKRYIIRKPVQVVNMLKEIIEDNNLDPYVTISFQDDAIHPNYLDKLADEIIKADLKIFYYIFARFEEPFKNKELLEKLHKSGLSGIYWGLESGCQSVLDKMNKGTKIENAYTILKLCYEVGITNTCGFIINFPTETMEEYNETLKFVDKVKQYTVLSPGRFGLMKTSIINENPDKYGLMVFGADEFSYCPNWRYKNSNPGLLDYKWNYFCECMKNDSFNIDYTKTL